MPHQPPAKSRHLLILAGALAMLASPAAARELTDDDRKMQERVTALSKGQGSLADFRIEMMDGSGMSAEGMKIYEIARGAILGQVWDTIASPAERRQGTASDEQVRQLLNDLVAAEYWTFEGTQFIPDAPTFIFRFQDKDVGTVQYACDASEFRDSPERAAIRALLLRFVDEDPEPPPAIPRAVSDP